MINKTRRNQGSGGVYTITATAFDNMEDFEDLIKETYESIDKWASPSIMRNIGLDGNLKVEIKYYGLD